ncbi:MAG: OmpA family protein [Campylobacterota bacterium]|nr:OmpA family protein [Campylobacterota bacterium]
MNSILKNTILGMCAIGLLAGCASKDVEYDDTASSKKAESSAATETTNVDDKAASIAGTDETSVSDNTDTVATNAALVAVTNEGVNSVESDIDGKTVLLESVHFSFDKYSLTDEMREVATSNYNKINETQQSYNGLKIKLEGNCDEWGTDEYNYALGLKRAKTTKDALVADGIDANSIVMVSFGESNPVCTQKNTTCWKMNRRVDYRLLP